MRGHGERRMQLRHPKWKGASGKFVKSRALSSGAREMSEGADSQRKWTSTAGMVQRFHGSLRCAAVPSGRVRLRRSGQPSGTSRFQSLP